MATTPDIRSIFARRPRGPQATEAQTVSEPPDGATTTTFSNRTATEESAFEEAQGRPAASSTPQPPLEPSLPSWLADQAVAADNARRLGSLSLVCPTGMLAGQPLEISGDDLIRRTNEVLSTTPGIPVRKAMYLAFADLAGIDLSKPHSYQGWDADPSWMNGDHVTWLGESAIPALIQWSDGGHGEVPGLVELLTTARLTMGDAREVLERVTGTQDPALVSRAVDGVLQNPSLPISDWLRLLSSHFDRELRNEVYAPDGTLADPIDFSPVTPCDTDLVRRMVESPRPDQRSAAARLLPHLKLPATEAMALADQLLEDPDLHVRVAAAQCFWVGSDTTAARQQALLDGLSTIEAMQQARLEMLGVGLSKRPFSFEGDFPDAHVGVIAEARAEFAGTVLSRAPAAADVSPVALEAVRQPTTTGITEDVLVYLERSSMDVASKVALLSSLEPGAVEDLQETFAIQSLVGRLVLDPTCPVLPQNLREHLVPFAHPRRDQLLSELQSQDPTVRKKAVLDAQSTGASGSVAQGLLASGCLTPTEARALVDAISPGAEAYGAVLTSWARHGGDPAAAVQKLRQALKGLAKDGSDFSAMYVTYNLYAAAPALLANSKLPGDVIAQTVTELLMHPALVTQNNHFWDPVPGSGPQATLLRLKRGGAVLPDLVRMLGDGRVTDALRTQALGAIFEAHAGGVNERQIIDAVARAGTQPEVLRRVASSRFQKALTENRYDQGLIQYIVRPAEGRAGVIDFNEARRAALETKTGAGLAGLPPSVSLSQLVATLQSAPDGNALRAELERVLGVKVDGGGYAAGVVSPSLLPAPIRQLFRDAAVKELDEVMLLISPESIAKGELTPEEQLHVKERLASYNANLTGTLTWEFAKELSVDDAEKLANLDRLLGKTYRGSAYEQESGLRTLLRYLSGAQRVALADRLPWFAEFASRSLDDLPFDAPAVLDQGVPQTSAELLARLIDPGGNPVPDDQVGTWVTQLVRLPDFAISAEQLSRLEAVIAGVNERAGGSPNHWAPLRFELHAAAGATYDALRTRFGDALELRWDLADAARKQSEGDALRVLLETSLGGYGVSQDAATLAIHTAAHCSLSEPHRRQLLLAGFAIQKQTALTALKQWQGKDLSFAAGALAELAERMGQDVLWRQGTSEPLNEVISDPRLPADAAVEIVRRLLENGAPGEAFVTYDVTHVLGLWRTYETACAALFSRTDVPDPAKRQVAQAFLALADLKALIASSSNSWVPELAPFPQDLARAWLSQRTAELEARKQEGIQNARPGTAQYAVHQYDHLLAALQKRTAVAAIG